MNEIETNTDSLIKTIDEVFSKQQKFALQCRTEPIKARAKRLKKLELWIEKNQKVIQDAIYKDFKKPGPESSITEIYPILTEIRHALTHLTDWASPTKIDAPISFIGTTSYIQYEPKGVCLIIAPWNYPFNLCLGPLVSAIAAGNTAIVKPSEMTPHTAKLIDDMIGELFTEEEVRVFNGGIEVSQHLLSLPFDHIFFTGSPNVGKIVMKAASEHLTSVTLELGGKSPAVVDERADLKDSAEKIAWGKFTNNGQTCVAPDYVLIHQSVEQGFIKHLKEAIEKFYNDSESGIINSKAYGRIVNEKHFERINQLIQNALNQGAELVRGGDTDPSDNFIPPTVLNNIPDEAEIMHEEIFGPVLPIKTYSTIEEAASYINSKPKPLALYYFGGNKKSRKHILTNTSSGGVCVNETMIHVGHPELPFGGVNNSGIGKSHGKYGFLAFSNEKPVLKQRVGLTNVKPLYPPYGTRVRQMIKILMKYL